MNANTPLDYAVLQLSPKCSRCSLFITSKEKTEKLGSGLLKSFVSHLKVAESLGGHASSSIEIKADQCEDPETCFTKGTLKRFVQFVSAPEILETVNAFDEEMSQLEAARRIYSQGAGEHSSGRDGAEAMAGTDVTKKELLRAIDVRLAAVKQDLLFACANASSAGFNLKTASELQLFSEQFGAPRLNEACSKFLQLYKKRPDLIRPRQPTVEDQIVRSSWGSDMSIDDPTEDSPKKTLQIPNLPNESTPSPPPVSTQVRANLRGRQEQEIREEPINELFIAQQCQTTTQLSVQDRINLFESKRKESSGGKLVISSKSTEARALSSDISSPPVVERAVLRRWSGASDMSLELGNEKKSCDSNADPSVHKKEQGEAGELPSETIITSSSEGFTVSDDLKMKGNDMEMPCEEDELQARGVDDEDDEHDGAPLMKMIGGDVDVTKSLRYITTHFSPADDSRGKFYEKYMKKRDEKLKEEWSTKRVEKEAKLKALQDSLEQSRAEMNAQFCASAARKNSSRPLLPEKVRSFNDCSGMKTEQEVDFAEAGEENDRPLEMVEKKNGAPDGSCKETSSSSSSMVNTFPKLSISQSKKILGAKSQSLSALRASASPLTPAATKNSTPNLAKRRHLDNLLMQSVPSLSDLRKENAKSSSPAHGIGKTASNRILVKNSSRSKVTAMEDLPLSAVKDERARRTNSMRKTLTGSFDSKDEKDHVVRNNLYDKFLKNVETKPFLRKGNGIGPGSGASIAKLKALPASDSKNGDEIQDSAAFEGDDNSPVRHNESPSANEFEPKEEDDGDARLSHESDRINDSSDFFTPDALPEQLQTISATPGESPVSWNSPANLHEASDADPSCVGSPIGSPAVWNTDPNPNPNTVVQLQGDAARMRKKLGGSQKSNVLGGNSSHNQSLRDVTKGFKRLLKFARRSRGTENLGDGISATTSEGDEDSEEVRDATVIRSSDDSRKSRMAFSHSQSFASDFSTPQVNASHSSIPAPPDNFRLRDGRVSGSSIKAPRSFFSLSNFRSRSSDSKPK